jgi:hypothetical protein
MVTKKMNMFFGLALLGLMMTIAIAPVAAAKPADNTAGAKKVPWHLSGAVMPSPPWGLHDIVGSDTASKLVVNRPMGNTEATITGVMKGLDPNTVYRVSIANAWTTTQVWDVTGTWVLSALSSYNHDYILSMQQYGGVITGSATYPAGQTPSIYETIIGTVVGTTVTIHGIYYSDAAHTIATGCEFDAILIINTADGSMSGTFIDNGGGGGSLASTAGHANLVTIGAGWPGLFNNMQTFTFTTNGQGIGNWHINLKTADFPSSGTYDLSVWINRGSFTVLINDNFQVIVG